MNNTIFAGDAGSKALYVIDGASNTVAAQHFAGAGPFVAVNPVNNQVIAAGPSPASSDPGQRGARSCWMETRATPFARSKRPRRAEWR
jgi:hypothetical protein